MDNKRYQYTDTEHGRLTSQLSRKTEAHRERLRDAENNQPSDHYIVTNLSNLVRAMLAVAVGFGEMKNTILELHRTNSLKGCTEDINSVSQALFCGYQESIANDNGLDARTFLNLSTGIIKNNPGGGIDQKVGENECTIGALDSAEFTRQFSDHVNSTSNKKVGGKIDPKATNSTGEEPFEGFGGLLHQLQFEQNLRLGKIVFGGDDEGRRSKSYSWLQTLLSKNPVILKKVDSVKAVENESGAVKIPIQSSKAPTTRSIETSQDEYGPE